jgi:protein BCP1
MVKRKDNENDSTEKKEVDDISSESDVSDEEDEDLILEGVLTRNPDVSDSDDDSSSEDEDDAEEDTKPPPSKKAKAEHDKSNQQQSQLQKKKKKKPREGPDLVHVDFTFCDMDELYFHGLKTLLTSSSPIFAAQSSGLADMMIKNISVGTVLSTEADTDGTIFGYASVLNVTTYQDEPAMQALKKKCLEKCPAAHKSELEVVFSGKTKRPAGLYLQGRMVNLPLEIVEVLHQQLVLDMDWAVKNAQGVDRKSLDFGAFVRIAPASQTSGVTYYKYFDDEIFSQHAEFTFEMELPKIHGIEEIPLCVVMVMTKSGHRAAMESLSLMVNGSGNAE